MHDFYLGICRYDMTRIIKYFIKNSYFTLDTLNNRLKYFDFSECDRDSKLSSLNPKHIQNGYIITAAQISFLVFYFSILVRDLIEEDPVWEFYLILFDIINIVTSSMISDDEIICLEKLIKSHNDLFIKLFQEDLKPKYISVHYSKCIELMGPLKSLSCSKFEFFHQI